MIVNRKNLVIDRIINEFGNINLDIRFDLEEGLAEVGGDNSLYVRFNEKIFLDNSWEQIVEHEIFHLRTMLKMLDTDSVNV